MTEIKISYKGAVKTRMVSMILNNWLPIHVNRNMFWSDIDRLIIGWIEGDHDLIYNTEDIIKGGENG